jgi:hypothetical protein
MTRSGRLARPAEQIGMILVNERPVHSNFVRALVAKVPSELAYRPTDDGSVAVVSKAKRLIGDLSECQPGSWICLTPEPRQDLFQQFEPASIWVCHRWTFLEKAHAGPCAQHGRLHGRGSGAGASSERVRESLSDLVPRTQREIAVVAGSFPIRTQMIHRR